MFLADKTTFLSLSFNTTSAFSFAKVMTNLNVNEKALVVLNDNDANVILSAKNIPSVKTGLTNTINVYDVVNAKTLVLTQDAVKTIEEVYA